RTGEDGDRILGSAGGFRRQRAKERRSAGLFFEEVTITGGIRQCRGEFGWRSDFRRLHPPGLLAALARDFSPTLSALGGGGGQAFFSARGTRGNHAGDAARGRFPHQPTEPGALGE